MTEKELEYAKKEKALASIVVISRMAAVHATISTMVRVSDDIISHANLSKDTKKLFSLLRNDAGITVDFLGSIRPEDFFNSITPRTRFVYIECGKNNADTEKMDIKKIADAIHKYRIPLVIDCGDLTSEEYPALEKGADIVLRNCPEGCVVSQGGNFDWRVCNVPLLKAEDPTFENIRWAFDLPEEDSNLPFLMRFKAISELAFGTKSLEK